MENAWITARIARKAVEAVDIVTLDLVHAEGQALPRFEAGSHIDLELPGGRVRQYSLCNAPRETHRYQLGVLLDPASRGGSRSVHQDLAEGATVRISAPRNHFPLVPARHSILLAGGIGVTPLLSMAENLSQAGADFELHCCSRSVARTAFLPRLRGSAFADRVQLHFDDGDAVQKLDAPAVLDRPAPGTHLYVCGPKGFMDFVLGTARALGWAEANLHCEHFAGAAQDRQDDGSFEVRIASTGRVIRVAKDESVVAALAAQGVDIPISCEQGVCGTCITRVLEGEPEHRDLYFSDAEKAKNDQFTPCCSRARSALLVLGL